MTRRAILGPAIQGFAIGGFAILAAAAGAAPAAAQSWGVGVEFGGPEYGPPPGYYAPPPGYYAPAPGYYAPPPGYGAPPQPTLQLLSPDAVFDALEDAGYREFGVMAPHGNYYSLDAVNPRGDLVALEVSAFTGLVERERVLALNQRPPRVERRMRAPVAVEPPKRRPAAPPPNSHDGNPDVVY